MSAARDLEIAACNLARRWRTGNDSQRATVLQEIIDLAERSVRGELAAVLYGATLADRLDYGQRGALLEALAAALHTQRR